MKHCQTTLAILAALFASIALADDFKTIDGKEYKNVTVSRVEPDGIVLKTKSGISKVYFVELPKDVQERFHYNSSAAADLMGQAESALRSGQFGPGAELLNRIVTEYPTSRQAQTVYDLRAFLRDKQQTQGGPLTASEAQRLRSVMDALASIKRNYRTATPEKREAMETLLGVENLRDADNGLGSVSSSGAKLRDATDKARQDAVIPGTAVSSLHTSAPAGGAAGCLDFSTAKPALDNAAASLEAGVRAAKNGDTATAASHIRKAATSLRTAASAESADAAISHPLMTAAESYDKAAAEYARGDETGAALYAAAAIEFVKTSNAASQHSSVPRCR
jgi:hypothetical protein